MVSQGTALCLALLKGAPGLVSHSVLQGPYHVRHVSLVVRFMPTDDITIQELLKGHDVKLLAAALPLSNPTKSLCFHTCKLKSVQRGRCHCVPHRGAVV